MQIDQSGNVWTVNNWSLESQPGAIVGGDGLIKFIGLASPTAAPLIGSPVDPATGNVGFISLPHVNPGNSSSNSNGLARPTWPAPPRNSRDDVFSDYGPRRAAMDFAVPELRGDEEDNESDASLAVVWQKLDLDLGSLFDGSIEDSPVSQTLHSVELASKVPTL